MVLKKFKFDVIFYNGISVFGSPGFSNLGQGTPRFNHVPKSTTQYAKNVHA